MSSQFTNQQKIDELWRRGILQFKLHPAQKLIHKAVSESKAPLFVINSSRRLGKSYFLCCHALEYAIQHPGAQIKFAAPNQKMVRKIITPLMKQILANCPKALRPRFKSLDGVYEFPNGSEISVAGTEMGQIDNLRGTAMDLGIIDEAGFATDLEYVIGSVLMPQTLTRPNARIILASTPPVSPDHAFVTYAQKAMEQSAYARFTIYDNPMITPERIEEYKFESGGEKSTTWRREYLAEFVTDRDSALFPEASDDAMEELIADIERPQFFVPFTSVDLGYLDYTGALLGYYDFLNAKVVIEDEVLVNKSNSADLVKLIRDKEKALWGEMAPKTRVVDGNALQIADLNALHKFACHAPAKFDLVANVNRVRIDIQERRLLINPRCTNLINQMKFATWDASRTKFSRSSSGGHWDLVAALLYFLKHIDRRTSPIPPGYGHDPYSTWGVNYKPKHGLTSTIEKIFPTLRR